MAGGFDPAEFAAFKAGSSSTPAPGPAAEPAPVSAGFDPAEFEAYKANSSSARGSDSEPLQVRVGAPEQSAFDERFGPVGPTSRETDALAVAGDNALATGMRRTADEALIGKPSLSNTVNAGLLRAGETIGLNAPRNVAAALAAGADAIGIEGRLPKGSTFSAYNQLLRDYEDATARQSPKATTAGTVAGIGVGAAALPVANVAKGAGWGARAVNNAATGFGYGFASEALDKHDPIEASKAGGFGALAGGLGSAALDGAAKVYGAFSRAGVPFRDQAGRLTDQAAAALREVGVDPAAITPQIEAAFAGKGASPAVAREAMAAEQGITLSRGQATQSPVDLGLEGAALSGSRGSRAQEIGQSFEARQGAEIEAARGRLQGMAARGEPMIDNPQQAFESVADRARMVGDDFSRQATAAQSAQDAALRAVRGSGPADVLDGATQAVDGLRDAARQSRAAYGAAYDDVGAIEGTFLPGTFHSAGERVRALIGAETPILPASAPVASQALSMIDDMGRSFGLRPGQEPTLQHVMAFRKGLSRLYPATAQNGTDRHALGEVVRAFDDYAEELLSIGRFREGPQAPRSAPEADGLFAPQFARSLDDETGAAAERNMVSGSPFDTKLPNGRESGSPEGLFRFLAKNGGVPLDGETRAADLHKTYYPGTGTLARQNAPTWDQLRVRLHEEGFLNPETDGYFSGNDVRDWVLDRLHQERIGRQKTYRIGDEPTGMPDARIADENAGHAAMVDREARRIAIELEPFIEAGHRIDRAAVREAAEARILGRDDGDMIASYERAVERRASEGANDLDGVSARTMDGADDVPFPELGEGVGPAGDFPLGSTAPMESMRKARGLFREYKQTFAPRGPGDVAGQRLRAIVERDASPNDVVTSLFGTTTGRVSSGQLQTLGRLREATGSQSPAWQAVQQSIIVRYVGGDGRDLGKRLDYLLRGEGRPLASFLTEEQRGGLARLRAATTEAERAQVAAPEWVQGLERSGFDPNRIASSIFGSGVPGSRVGAANEAKAAKAFLGENSAEWSMLRQAAVQRLTDRNRKAADVVKQVRAFTDGPGSGLARELFDASEIGQLRRFSSALNATILSNGAAKPNSEGPARVAAKALDLLAGAVAFKAGGAVAAGTAYSAKPGSRLLIGGVGARRARQSFDDGAPRLRASGAAPSMPAGRFGVGTGLVVGESR